MSRWLNAEIPEVNKRSIACAVTGRLKLRGSVIALTDKRLGRYLDILDQKVEAGGDSCLAAAAVGGQAISSESVIGSPVRYVVAPDAVSTTGPRQLIIVIVGIDNHCLANTG